MHIQDLKKYIKTSDNQIYKTQSVKFRIIEVNSALGFWCYKRNRIDFLYIIKTSDNYLEMR